MRTGGEKKDHSECMVLALQLDDEYWKAILGVASKQALAGDRLARVDLTLMST